MEMSRGDAAAATQKFDGDRRAPNRHTISTRPRDWRSTWSIADISLMSIFARFWMDMRTTRSMPAMTNLGTLVVDVAVARSTNSSASSFNEAKGESRTMASIMLSSSA